MPADIRVVAMRASVVEKPENIIVNTCSNSKESWSSDFSPFLLGPCNIPSRNAPAGFSGLVARNMENAWQYSKLYEKHAKDGNPTEEWELWARSGWENPKAVRYPMGKGAVPLCSVWGNQKLGYIDARKQIYGPLYRDLVVKTPGFKQLVQLHNSHPGTIYLRDFDGYDEVEKEMTLTEVLNFPRRKMGHAFVLKMLLLADPALEQFGGRK